MRIDNEVVLSPSGRQAIEVQLRQLLVERENYRAVHAQAVRDAASTQLAIIRGQKLCDALCDDLGFVSEGEAIKELLGGMQTGRVHQASHISCDSEAVPDREVRRG